MPGPPPDELLAPMLARSGTLPHDQDAWAFEVKWDGVRAIVRAEPDGLRLWSRLGNDITGGYPELAALHAALDGHDAILDGEIIAFDDAGRPSFQALQSRMHARGPEVRRLMADRPVTLMLFDLLWLDGRPLIDLPYDERREQLLGLGLDGPAWQTPAAHPGQGDALLAATADQGLEGVIAKRRDAPYRPGRRSDAWIKIKHELRQELVIGGWLPGKGERTGVLGSLQVGVYDGDGRLRHAGGVGTGFDRTTLERLTAKLERLERRTSPFTGRQPPSSTRFVTPKLVGEVRFAGWTSDGSVRQASFLGLRDDKDATAVVRETLAEEPTRATDDGSRSAAPSPRTAVSDAAALIPSSGESVTIEVEDHPVKLSNLDKILYPATGTTKADVLRYYAAIAPVLLPHLRDHPVTLKRYPHGVEGTSFFEKHANRYRPNWVQTVPVPTRANGGGIVDYLLIHDLPTLLWAVNLAALEFHPSLSAVRPGRTEDDEVVGAEVPASLVFDLDPGPGTSIVESCRVGLEIRSLLDELDLDVVAKTSGSKGLQLYVPLNGTATYDQTRPFAQAVASLLEQRHPERIVSRMAKRLREGRIFIDWSQNSAHKTTVAVYSLRAREQPTVSTPVTWDEVASCAASGDPDELAFRYDDVLERVTRWGDLFTPLLETEQTVPVLTTE